MKERRQDSVGEEKPRAVKFIYIWNHKRAKVPRRSIQWSSRKERHFLKNE